MLCDSKTTYADVIALRQEHNDNTDHKSTKCSIVSLNMPKGIYVQWPLLCMCENSWFNYCLVAKSPTRLCCTLLDIKQIPVVVDLHNFTSDF